MTILLQAKYRTNPQVFLLLSVVIFVIYYLIALNFDFIVSSIVLSCLILALFGGYWLIRYPTICILIMVIGTSLDALGRIGGSPITVFHIGVLLTTLSMIINIFYHKRFSIKSTSFDISLWLFLVLIAVSLLYSPNKLDGLLHFARLIVLIIVMYMVINVVDKPYGIYLSVLAFISIALILSLISLKSLMGTSASVIQSAMSYLKLFGGFGVTFENANYFAIFLMITILLGLSLVINCKLSIIFRTAILIALSIITMAFVGTFTRAAWLAMVPGILMVSYFSKYRKMILIGGVGIVLLVILILWQSFFVQSLIMRIKSVTDATGDPSNVARIYLFSGGWQMFTSSYFLGVGYRGFPVHYEQFYRPPSQQLYAVIESHTLPMQIMAELGLLGLLLFCLIFFGYFKFGFKSINEINNNLLKALQIGFVAATFALFIFFLFSPTGLENNFLWIIIGLTFATDQVAKNKPELFL